MRQTTCCKNKIRPGSYIREIAKIVGLPVKELIQKILGGWLDTNYDLFFDTDDNEPSTDAESKMSRRIILKNLIRNEHRGEYRWF